MVSLKGKNGELLEKLSKIWGTNGTGAYNFSLCRRSWLLVAEQYFSVVFRL